MFYIDSEKKITVSLGGKCSLGCKHCYTNCSAFLHQDKITVKELIKDLGCIDSNTFTTICISGDVDTFLNPYEGLELIALLAEIYRKKTIMFTTRLVPNDNIKKELTLIGKKCLERGQLFIPCISVISFAYPNQIENSKLVPSTTERLDFFIKLCKSGIPCFLTLRPTFPFEIVQMSEIVNILKYVKNLPASVLGEVLLLDQNGEIEKRLGMQVINKNNPIQISKMTFLNQECYWKKVYFRNEHKEIKKECNNLGMPFFLRSMSAIRYIERSGYMQNGYKHNERFFNDEELDIFP